jgi:rod shape determining protein RodA
MREKLEKLRKIVKNIDYIIVLVMTILIGIGFFCTRQAFQQDEDLKAILIKQTAGILIGYFLFIVVILIDYHFYCNISLLIYFAMIAILTFTLVAGPSINNVNRWIMIFGIPFQPSELTKVALILVLAFLCNRFRSKLNKLSVFFILAATAALPIALILLEPHLSSGMSLLFIFCIIVYSSGISYKVIGAALALALPVIAGLFISVSVFQVDLPFIEEYQIMRVLFFLSTDEEDDQSGDFQQNQSIAAIGSGGLHGKTISMNEEDRRYRNLYAKESDFVFAVVGEEFGFIGSFIILMLYAILIFRCITISIRTTDYMGRIICMGVSSYLMFQIFVNIGVAIKILPNTGLTLPFISYGLTSLISSMLAVALVVNIGIRQKIKKETHSSYANLSFASKQKNI